MDRPDINNAKRLIKIYRNAIIAAASYDCSPYPSESKLTRLWQKVDNLEFKLIGEIEALILEKVC